MKIVYMGTPDFAVPPLTAMAEAGHEIAAVVTKQDAVSGRGKKVRFSPVKEKALELGIEVLQPGKVKGNEEFLGQLREIAPDIIVVAAYGKILPKEVLELPPKGCINVHASLLPRFRGAAPIQAAIIEGDEQTGVTIMKMEEGLDTGDMLTQTAVTIGEMTGEQLHDALAEAGAKLLVETLEKLDSITPRKQDDEKSTYAPMISKEDGHADFGMDPARLSRIMRAFDPWPGTFCFMGDLQIKLWHGTDLGTPCDAPQGTVVAVGAEGIDISAGGGLLRVDTIQVPGKKRVAVKEYLKGNSIEIGTVLR